MDDVGGGLSMRYATYLAPVVGRVVVPEVSLLIDSIGCGFHAVCMLSAESLPEGFRRSLT